MAAGVNRRRPFRECVTDADRGGLALARRYSSRGLFAGHPAGRSVSGCSVGSRRAASRNSANPSFHCPSRSSATPKFMWNPACSGSSATAWRYFSNAPRRSPDFSRAAPSLFSRSAVKAAWLSSSILRSSAASSCFDACRLVQLCRPGVRPAAGCAGWTDSSGQAVGFAQMPLGFGRIAPPQILGAQAVLRDRRSPDRAPPSAGRPRRRRRRPAASFGPAPGRTTLPRNPAAGPRPASTRPRLFRSRSRSV